jgi:hypothetical protein
MVASDSESHSSPNKTKDTTAVSSAMSHSKRHHSIGPIGVGIAAAGIGALLLLVGTVAGFAASRVLDHVDRDDRSGMFGSRMSGDMPGHMMSRGTIGKVTSVSSGSITLTDNRSGGSVTFQLNSNTDVKSSSGDAAKISDIKVGDTVSVRGTSATDDTLADTIIINPSTRL